MKLNRQSKIFGGLTMAFVFSICLFTSTTVKKDAYADLVVDEAEQCFEGVVNGQCVRFCPPTWQPVVIPCK